MTTILPVVSLQHYHYRPIHQKRVTLKGKKQLVFQTTMALYINEVQYQITEIPWDSE